MEALKPKAQLFITCLLINHDHYIERMIATWFGFEGENHVAMIGGLPTKGRGLLDFPGPDLSSMIDAWSSTVARI